MNCPRCGKGLPAGAAFCMHCGQAIAAVPQAVGAPPSTGMPMAMPSQRKSTALALLIAALGVGAVVIGLGASGVLSFGAKSPSDKLLDAQGRGPKDALLNITGKPPESVLAKTAEAPLEMPADVEAWLKHLEKCEEMKQQIGGDQAAEVSLWAQKNSVLGAGMGLMDPYDQSKGAGDDKSPDEYTKGKILDLRPKWEELLDFFRSVAPPEECRPIASDFDHALTNVPGMMGDIGEVLNMVSSDPTKAMQQAQKMKQTSYDDIDRYFARTDEKVTAICSKYNKRKWFNIKQDVGAGGVLGKLGGL